MTKRELQSRVKLLEDEIEMLYFSVALSDAELPLAKAAAYAIRDKAHTAEEAQAIVERIASRLIPLIEMMRGAEEAKTARETKIIQPASPIILAT